MRAARFTSDQGRCRDREPRGSPPGRGGSAQVPGEGSTIRGAGGLEGRGCPFTLGESAGSGTRSSRALLVSELCPVRGRRRAPLCSFRRVGAWSRHPGCFATLVPRRCGQKGSKGRASDTLSGTPSREGGRCRGIFFFRLRTRLARTQRKHRRCCAPSSVPAPQLSLALFFSEPLPAPAARSQSKERKKKRGGGGAADSSVLPVLLWEDSSAATGGEGLREGSGEGASGSLRDLMLMAPRASLGGGSYTAKRGAGGGSPRGCTTSPGGGDARSLISARSPLSEILQGLWRSAGKSIHVWKTRET